MTAQKVTEVVKAMNFYYSLCLVCQDLLKAVDSASQDAF